MANIFAIEYTNCVRCKSRAVNEYGNEAIDHHRRFEFSQISTHRSRDDRQLEHTRTPSMSSN